MTLPVERTRAVLAAEGLLAELAAFSGRRGEMIRIPRELAVRAGLILRHYPRPLDIDLAATRAPHVFGIPERHK